MIQMIKINLLPYREALLQKQKQQFKTLMLLALILGIALAALTFMTLNSSISSQQERNQVLRDGVAELDKQIAEIKKLEEEKANFIARKQKVEELENMRFEGARIIDTINTLVPEGLYLSNIAAKNEFDYTITGKAISDSKIAMFMRALPSTGLFKTPELVSIRKVDDAQEFVVQITLNRQPVAPAAPAQ